MENKNLWSVKGLEWRNIARNENNILVQRNVKGKCVSKTLTVIQTMGEWPVGGGGGGERKGKESFLWLVNHQKSGYSGDQWVYSEVLSSDQQQPELSQYALHRKTLYISITVLRESICSYPTCDIYYHQSIAAR